MTSSLTSRYALVGEAAPSQAPHQSGIPPGPPHAIVEPSVQAPEPTKVVAAPAAPKVARVVPRVVPRAVIKVPEVAPAQAPVQAPAEPSGDGN
jgi:hypothetical protein